MKENLMITSKFAETAGINSKAIRYYARIGLLHPVRNPANGYREYTDSDVSRARLIRKAQLLGLTLEDVQTLLAEASSEASADKELRRIVINRSLENQQQLLHFQTTQERLETVLASWPSTPSTATRKGHGSDLLDSLEWNEKELGAQFDYKFFECRDLDEVAV
jgi:DNA-binding transcriptional MerR regulator